MRRIAVLALSTLLIAQPAAALERWLATAWTKKLQRTSTLLKQGKYAAALPILEKLLREMLDALGPGDETTYVLAIPLIQRALAEAGNGDRATALWHWQMAQTIYPKTAEADLSMFGEPGAFLAAHVLVDPRLESCPRGDDEALAPPVVEKRIAPAFPEGVLQFRESGLLIVYVKVGADGIPTEPRLVKPLATPLAYSTLEVLRSWKFSPATKRGVPVDSGFCVSVNYKLK